MAKSAACCDRAGVAAGVFPGYFNNVIVALSAHCEADRGGVAALVVVATAPNGEDENGIVALLVIVTVLALCAGSRWCGWLRCDALHPTFAR